MPPNHFPHDPEPNRVRRALLGSLSMAVVSLSVGACGGAPPLSAVPTLPAQNRRRGDIERDFVTTLARCIDLAPATGAAFSAAVGELVFPTIITAGIDGELAGDGALRVGQAFMGYYLLSAVPAQTTSTNVDSLIFLFTDFDALSRFQRAGAWPAGDQDLAVPLIGADGRLDPRSRGAPVLAIALGAQQLLPALTLNELRITPLAL